MGKGKKPGNRKFRPLEEGDLTPAATQEQSSSSTTTTRQQKTDQGKNRTVISEHGNPKRPSTQGEGQSKIPAQQEIASSSSVTHEIKKLDLDGQKSNAGEKKQFDKGNRKFRPVEERDLTPAANQEKSSFSSTNTTRQQKTDQGKNRTVISEHGNPKRPSTQGEGQSKIPDPAQQETSSSSSVIHEVKKLDLDGQKLNAGEKKQSDKEYKQYSSTIPQKMSKTQQPWQGQRPSDQEAWRRQGDKKKDIQKKKAPSGISKESPPQPQSQIKKQTGISATNRPLSENKDVDSGEAKYQLLIPKPGELGRRIRVETNYFKIDLGNIQTVYHYDVKITPEHKRIFRNVMEQFGHEKFPSIPFAYDNKYNMYTVKKLEDIVGETAFEGRQYNVQVKFARLVDLAPLHDLAKSQITPREALQVVDIVLRSSPSVSLLRAGRSFFFTPGTDRVNLEDGMELYNGFYQSAARGQHIYLNVDVAHKAVPKCMKLTEAISDLFDSQYRRIDLTKGLDEMKVQKFNAFIERLRIAYQLPNKPSSKRSYTINGLKRSARFQRFRLDNGQEITVENYFKNEKGYIIRYPNLPTVWVGNRDRCIYLPLELCVIEKDQMIKKELTPANTRNMITKTATCTRERKDKIKASIAKAQFNNHPVVQNFGFNVNNEFLQLDGRILQPPTLLYKNNNSATPEKGQWFKSKNHQFQYSVDIKKWTIISCTDERGNALDVSQLYRLANMIQNSRELNLPAPGHIQTVQNIKTFFLETIKGQNYDIIFVVVPDQSTESYSSVKKAAELYSNCLTQCIKYRTATTILRDDRKGPQTIANIMLKVNMKLNGINHTLKQLPKVLENCMVMGADVTHPAPGSKIKPSVAAVTASYDSHASQYTFRWRLQGPRVEMIQDMEAIVRELLLECRQKTNTLPKTIIYFRDGVSEGEYNKVVENEVQDIKAACFRLDQNYRPKITCIVVQKRHHTRLFPVNERDIYDRKNFNVPAGTCVDTEITHPYMQEYYLVSHASIKGVARPTKYTTLVDDNKLSNDDLEQMTYYLCHLYSRCNRSVSYPAPTYNAHLAAARAKVYTHNEELNFDNLDQSYARLMKTYNIRQTNPMYFI